MTALALKIFFLLTLLIGIRSHDLHLGYPDPSSRLFYQRILEESPALWQRSKDVYISTNGRDVINSIDVIDLREDRAGEVYVKKGGVGETSVTLELNSPTILRGYRFLVEVHAIDNGYYFYRRN